MKLSAHEEYGLRCLLRIGLAGPDESLTIPEISQAEALSPAYAAKLLRILRRGGFITSARGKDGGYTPARPAGQSAIGGVRCAEQDHTARSAAQRGRDEFVGEDDSHTQPAHVHSVGQFLPPCVKRRAVVSWSCDAVLPG